MCILCHPYLCQMAALQQQEYHTSRQVLCPHLAFQQIGQLPQGGILFPQYCLSASLTLNEFVIAGKH